MPTNISDIPNELFVEILWLLVLSVKPSKRYRVNRTSNRYSEWGFLAVIEVCSHWRNVALSEPKLWSLIDLTDEQTAKQCMLRSQNAWLRLSGPTNLHDDPSATVKKAAVLAVVGAAAERIISLKAIKTEIGIIDYLRSWIHNGKMKALRELEFNLKAERGITLDTTELPHLECLSLSGSITLKLRPDCFAGLRILILKFPEFTFQFSLVDFLDSFGTCVKLQELSVIGAKMAAEADLSSSNLPPRHFPSLTRISIGLQHPEQSYRLLDHITTLQDQDLHFVLYARDPASLTDTIPPHFLSLFSQPSTSPSRDFVLSVNQIDHNEIRIIVSSDLESSPKIFMALYVPNWNLRLEEDRVLEEVVQMFRSVQIKGLEIGERFHNQSAKKQSYQRLYNAFPGVERLQIKACTEYSIQALAAETTGVHPFNNLQDLEITLRYRHTEIAKSFLQTAKARCGPASQPIKRLTLCSSEPITPFSPRDTHQLREFAKDVFYGAGLDRG